MSENVFEIIVRVSRNILDLLTWPTMGYDRCDSPLWKECIILGSWVWRINEFVRTRGYISRNHHVIVL